MGALWSMTHLLAGAESIDQRAQGSGVALHAHGFDRGGVCTVPALCRRTSKSILVHEVARRLQRLSILEHLLILRSPPGREPAAAVVSPSYCRANQLKCAGSQSLCSLQNSAAILTSAHRKIVTVQVWYRRS